MSVCLNCAAAVDNDFCPDCGQQTKTKRAPIIDVMRDALADFFAFDSRIFKSFLPLIVRPGRLTEMYLEGKRTQLISPVRMYIFVSFIFFFFVMPDISSLNIDLKEMGVDDLGVDVDTEQKILAALNNSIRTLPHFLVLSIPLLAMVLSIAHRKPKTFLYDHLVFSLHIHTFLFLSMMVLSIIPSKSAVTFFIPFYFIYWLVAIKRCYKRSWLVTIPKTMVLFIFDPIILIGIAASSFSKAAAASGL